MRILREPLVHFLALGGVLFLVSALMGAGTEASERLVVTRGQIEHLAAGYARTWQRPPSPDQLQGLIRDYLREEVYYREALALGLDRDDIIIRRRLRQKLEFLAEDIAAQVEPTEAELRAYLDAHPTAFAVEQRLTFSQVFLSPERHGTDLPAVASDLLSRLRQAGFDADLSTLGDPLLLVPRVEGVLPSDVAADFGPAFADTLVQLPPGQWEGPVTSGYGVHLVLVRERTSGRVPLLAEVREAVRREWLNTRRLEANERFYQELLKRYTVTVEPLAPAEPERGDGGEQP